MESQKLIGLEQIFQGLMSRYKKRVPDVQKVFQSLISEKIITHENEIENDHVAFRTLGHPLLGIQSLARIFEHYGYTKKDYYYFEKKKLDAFWYAPPSDKFPRIFISELRINELTDNAQKIINKYLINIKEDPTLNINLKDTKAIDLYLHSSLWKLPSYEDYSTLIDESEYAAWTIYNRYYLNHFTVSIHNLPQPYNDIEKFTELLENKKFIMNTSGGVIKTSKDGLLRQCSTIAQVINSEFANNIYKDIAGSYVEFAERKVMPEFNHLTESEIQRVHRREGFEAANADKIFESTYINKS